MTCERTTPSSKLLGLRNICGPLKGSTVSPKQIMEGASSILHCAGFSTGRTRRLRFGARGDRTNSPRSRAYPVGISIRLPWLKSIGFFRKRSWMPWVRNSWPRLISLQPKASKSCRPRIPLSTKMAQSTRSKNMSAATVIRSTRFDDRQATEATFRPSAGLEPQAMTLETKHLSRTVVDRVLVSDIGVQVRPGEVLAVVGPSGAGKSSFLRLLNRLDEPTGGTVCLNGQDYRELSPQQLRRRVGMVMQVAYLFPGTVAANIAFGPRQRGESLASEQIAALLERVGLPG